MPALATQGSAAAERTGRSLVRRGGRDLATVQAESHRGTPDTSVDAGQGGRSRRRGGLRDCGLSSGLQTQRRPPAGARRARRARRAVQPPRGPREAGRGDEPDVVALLIGEEAATESKRPAGCKVCNADESEAARTTMERTGEAKQARSGDASGGRPEEPPARRSAARAAARQLAVPRSRVSAVRPGTPVRAP